MKLIEITDDLHAKLKVLAAKARQPMKTVVHRLLSMALAKKKS